jgi:hypothetical protein
MYVHNGRYNLKYQHCIFQANAETGMDDDDFELDDLAMVRVCVFVCTCVCVSVSATWYMLARAFSTHTYMHAPSPPSFNTSSPPTPLSGPLFVRRGRQLVAREGECGHTHTHTYTHTYTCTYMLTYIKIHTHTQTHRHTHIHTQTHTYTRTHTHTPAHAREHTHTLYKHRHTHPQTQTQTQTQHINTLVYTSPERKEGAQGGEKCENPEHTQGRTHIDTYTHTPIDTWASAHTHTHTHTHIYAHTEGAHEEGQVGQG